MDGNENDYGNEDYYVEGGDDEIVDLGDDIQPFSMSFKPKVALKEGSLLFKMPEKKKEVNQDVIGQKYKSKKYQSYSDEEFERDDDDFDDDRQNVE